MQPLPNGDPLLPRRPLHHNVQAHDDWTKCAVQAIPPHRFDFDERAGVSRKGFLHAIGNTMSANVLARVLGRALHAAGLTPEPRGGGTFLQALA